MSSTAPLKLAVSVYIDMSQWLWAARLEPAQYAGSFSLRTKRRSGLILKCWDNLKSNIRNLVPYNKTIVIFANSDLRRRQIRIISETKSGPEIKTFHTSLSMLRLIGCLSPQNWDIPPLAEGHRLVGRCWSGRIYTGDHGSVLTPLLDSVFSAFLWRYKRS